MTADRSEYDRRAALKLLGTAVAAGGLGITSACSDGMPEPEAVSRVPLARLSESERLRIEHGGAAVELSRTSRGIVARVMVCTHERCDIRWLSFADQYHCPCHGARFSADGRPLRGPVSRPLVEIPVRLEGEEVVVGPATSRGT